MNTCDPLGIPRNMDFETRGLAFASMPDRIAVLHQYGRIWRYVWMDGKHELPKKIDTNDGVPSRWYGYSVGHWDGDYALVIDTTGINDEGWLDRDGHPHSVNALVEERYTRVDHNHIQMVVTVDDPTIYTKPFELSKNEYRWIPDQEAEATDLRSLGDDPVHDYYQQTLVRRCRGDEKSLNNAFFQMRSA